MSRSCPLLLNDINLDENNSYDNDDEGYLLIFNCTIKVWNNSYGIIKSFVSVLPFGEGKHFTLNYNVIFNSNITIISLCNY